MKCSGRHQVVHLQLEFTKSPVSEYVTVSFGVASMIPKQDFSHEVLIDIADKALYEAKGQGRNRVILRAINSYMPEKLKMDYA